MAQCDIKQFTMSNKRDSFLELFNNKADEFFKDLVVTFPDIQQFKTFKTAFTMMKNLDERKPIKIFNEYISANYKDVIMNKDESFFLVNDIDLSQSTQQEYWKEFIDNLRNIWKDLEEDNKTSIWKYFQVLIVLNDKYMNST